MPERRKKSIRTYTNQNLLLIGMVLMSIFLVINLVPRAVLKNDTLNSIQILANCVKVNFGDRVAEIENIVNGVEATTGIVDMTSSQITGILDGIVKTHPLLLSLEIIDQGGRVTYSAPLDTVGMDRSYEGFFKEASQSDTYCWSDVFVFFLTGKPVISVTKRFSGHVIQAYINLELFSASSIEIEKQLGSKFQISVMDSFGTFVMNSNPQYIYQRIQNEEYAQIRDGKSSFFESVDGKSLVSVTRVGALNWHIALYADKDDAYYSLNIVNLLLMAATLMIVSVLGLFYMRIIRISQSISLFSEEITRFGSNYEVTALKEEPFRELDQLTRNFQSMGTRLRSMTDELNNYAYRDLLTGLHNRRAAMDVLKESILNGQRLILCYFDLDRFKEINDKLGHSTGDRFLQMISERLKSAVAQPDRLYRVGGDEFIYIIADSGDHEAFLQQINTIKMEFSNPFTYEDDQYHLGVSIGTALYPADADNVDDLLMHADIAMYQAKSKGTNFEMFNQDMQNKLLRELSIKQRLRNEDYFGELFYEIQPQYEISAMRIIGYEMFVRWNNPQSGRVFPDEFIPIAEATYAITNITYWMFGQAMDVLRMLDKHGRNTDLVAINISVVDLMQADFAQQMESRAKASGINAHRIVLEVTESVIINNYEQVKAALSRLTQIGFQISLDDFGKGYSSLSHLNELMIHMLKIDKAFLDSACENTRSQELIRSIIHVSERLGINIIVEGVETEAQLNLLAGLNAYAAQGYFLSRPLSKAAFTAILDEQYAGICSGMSALTPMGLEDG